MFPITVPPHLVIFSMLALYIWLHGWAGGTTGLPHYYWAGNALLLCAVHIWKLGGNSGRPLYMGIAVLALLQSAVVLLQCAGVVGVPNTAFLCTGTWGNPNVSALFLAFSFFALLRLQSGAKAARLILGAVKITALLAIVLLQCRSAYIVVLILLLHAYWAPVSSFFKKHLRFTATGAALGLALALALFISVFQFKAASAAGRIYIWQTSVQFAAQQPLTGCGFGLFEKEYNLYAAAQENSRNDHVDTPYNDWLEIAIEGGGPGIALWLGFLGVAAVYWYRRRQQHPGLLALLAAFAAVQLTNFCIEAVPANLLFIIYTGLHSGTTAAAVKIQLPPAPRYSTARRLLAAAGGLVLSMLLIIKVSGIAAAFYTCLQVSNAPKAVDKIAAYRQLNDQLHSYAGYQQYVGDAWREAKQYRNAITAYTEAMQKTSTPDIFTKTGYCYQQLNRYDSSELMYTTAQNMQPFRYIPRMALLKLYQQQQDTARAINKAKEILAMPVKVHSRQVQAIRQYAALVIQGSAGISTDSTAIHTP